MKRLFSTIKLPQEVFNLFSFFPSVNQTKVILRNSYARVLAKDIIASQDLPGFNRATMDGYAVKAEDTFGASDGSPAWLKIIGEVRMGEVPSFGLERGETVKIATGGMLPEGTNAVVMLEYSHCLDEATIEVFKPVAPLENVIRFDEDFSKGELIFSKGHRLRPQDIGVLAALGQTTLYVYKKVQVAIIATGDEVIPITQAPRQGQVRDVNSYTLSALIKETGGIPLAMGIVKDEQEELKKICYKALEVADVILICGGSSVGMRDFTLEVINSFKDSEILCHGVSISPGKPTIFARIKEKAVWGLPGQVSSAIIVFNLLVKDFIKWISGERSFSLRPYRTISAKMGVNVCSVHGREDYLRVKLKEKGDGTLWAEPILGKSGLINTLIRADGLVKIDLNTEGLDKAEEVEVFLF
jgi:molybdopterin molybdotransferase